MIPNVFVTSTIADLQHLRDGLREAILELGYNPVMSEYGEIGYLPTTSAAESCYLAMRDCQLAVLVLGKRYGSVENSDVSVTQNEFRTARDSGIPTVSLVDRDVLAFSQVHAANPGVPQKFPGMDEPERSFSFLSEVRSAKTNNGILPFASVTEARSQLKRQFAHLVGDLLRRQFETTTATLGDVLSELKTLRHELRGAPPSGESLRYLRAMQLLLEQDSSNRMVAELTLKLLDTLDRAVPLMLNAATFDQYLQSIPATLHIVSREELREMRIDPNTILHSNWVIERDPDSMKPTVMGEVALRDGKNVWMDEVTHKWFSEFHIKLLRSSRGEAG